MDTPFEARLQRILPCFEVALILSLNFSLILAARNLTPRRESIMEIMSFALERSKDAKDIAEILTEALTIRRTTMEKRLSRLYLLSDILFNDVLYNTRCRFIYYYASEPNVLNLIQSSR